MAFKSNSNDYTIITEGELGAVLQNFDPDMVFSVLENNLENKYREYELNLTNLVTSYEYQFKELADQYGQDNQIFVTRDQTYGIIIERICKFHDLDMPITTDNVDIYTLASIMYEFFVSSFTKYISRFFISYIYREKDSIYKMILSFDEDKKVKNNSITYAKKIYDNDPQLAAIHAYIPKVVESICQFPITLHEYISGVYKTEPQKADFLRSVLPDNEYFYSNFVVPFINNHSSRIIMDIRFALQSDICPTLNFPLSQ